MRILRRMTSGLGRYLEKLWGRLLLPPHDRGGVNSLSSEK